MRNKYSFTSIVGSHLSQKPISQVEALFEAELIYVGLGQSSFLSLSFTSEVNAEVAGFAYSASV